MSNKIGHPGGQDQDRSLLRTLLLIALPVLIIVGFVAVMMIVIALNEKPEEKRRPFNPLAVLAEVAVTDDVQLIVNTQGEARPRVEIDLVPEVGGKITRVSPKFIEGGIFNKGDVLFQIDTRNYDVAVIRAEATVARAQQVLIREKAEAEVARQDWADLGQGAPSDLTLRKPQMAEAQASLQSAQADLQNAKNQLARTSVRAPFNGRVRSKTSDLGQFVSPGSRMGRIFSTDIVEVRLPLTDDDLSKVNLPIAYVAKDRASAPDVQLSVVIGGQRQEWAGKIMRTDSTYDTQTRALFAIAEVFDPYGKGASANGVPLAPGLFVDAAVAGKKFENIVVIPRDGLRPEDKVFVAKKDGTAVIKEPQVLDTNTKFAYISEGLSEGDLIILSPVEESRLGGPLKVLDIKDTSKVLVNPPKPQWMVDKEKTSASDDAKKGDEKRTKRRKKNSSDSGEKPKKRTADKSGDAKATAGGSETP